MTRQSALVRPRAAAGVTTGCFHTRAEFPCGGVRAGEVSSGLSWIWTGAGAPSTGALNGLTNAIEAMFNTTGAAPATFPIAQHLSNAITRATGGCMVNIFQVDPISTDPGHLGPPISSSNFTLAPSSASLPNPALPNQLACVLSFRADYGTDEEFGTHLRPRASDRGRTFIGPLNGQAVAQTGIGLQYGCMAPAAVIDIGEAYAQIVAGLNSSGWLPAVWSRAEKMFKPAIEWAVNNAVDTLRKRASIVPALAWNALTLP